MFGVKKVFDPVFLERPLESTLAELETYGRPRLSKQETGWYCAIEMLTTVQGMDAKIASDFAQQSPSHAATQCLMRVQAAMATR